MNNFKVVLVFLFMITFLITGNSAPEKNTQDIKQSTVLIIKKIPLTVDGKSTEVFKIEQPDGTWGYQGIKGQYFDAVVKNTTDSPTVVHWHGLILPNSQDGVPYVTQAPIPAGGESHYHFKLRQAGTYWMHSHFDLQVQNFLSAPFIIYEPNEKNKEKDVVLFLGDFSYKKPATLLYELKNKGTVPLKTMGDMQQKTPMNNNSMKKTTLRTIKPDLNDVAYDAFLTNYHTLSNPEVIPVHSGEVVRLRIIDGAAMTNFFINLGKLQGKAIAVDGQPIKEIPGNQFQLAVGQRIDILIKIPEGEGAYPILAQGAGTQLQTGLILSTPGASKISVSEKASTLAGGLNNEQEFKTHSLAPLPVKQPKQTLTVTLDGDMMNYIWKMNNQAWPNITPLSVDKNKRIEIVIMNKTGMAHPMHLHGHFFEVTEIDGKPLKNGPMRDTVLVLPNSTVKIQFDTDNPGNWMFHCHMLYHEATGMMTFINYKGIKIPDYKKDTFRK
ncbi:multicopper oxidase family protein [Legionella bozemanae]|uniref:Multicopper oxidase n=1 Tax=Legionella bozemanae TaxID=447 RepID=A0A0W0RJU5_LEGBO|nr:multicopper oxidase family protein [Legionella bozemanae]KTC71295.1 Multicopper oxidase [Legionella bozemanae]STO33431.1 Copper resistance protein A precursor [Legionella bozemanae]